MVQLPSGEMVQLTADLLDPFFLFSPVIQDIKRFKDRIADAGSDAFQLNAVEYRFVVLVRDIQHFGVSDLFHDRSEGLSVCHPVFNFRGKKRGEAGKLRSQSS